MNLTSNIIISGRQAVRFINDMCNPDENSMNAMNSFLEEHASGEINFSPDCLFEVEDNNIKSPLEIIGQKNINIII